MTNAERIRKCRERKRVRGYRLVQVQLSEATFRWLESLAQRNNASVNRVIEAALSKQADRGERVWI